MPRHVLITAGAAGIGREYVRAFSANGDKVFTCDINEEALNILKQEIPELITTVCDISKRADIEKIVAFGAEKMGGYDVLINNAGIAGPTAPVEEVNPGDWEKLCR